jgi:hypothetical protein
VARKLGLDEVYIYKKHYRMLIYMLVVKVGKLGNAQV